MGAIHHCLCFINKYIPKIIWHPFLMISSLYHFE